MTRTRQRKKPYVADNAPFEHARDELFQHIMQCGVIGASEEHQTEWFNDTMGYLATRYPELADTEIAELRLLGERFAQPPKQNTTVEDADTVSAA